MWQAVLGYSGDPEVASDAVAEAFAQALRRTDLRSPVNWIWRTAFRVAAAELKRRRHPGAPASDRSYELEPQEVDVIRALAKLTPKQRAVVVLHHVADQPVAEVAATLGMRPPAVRMHLTRGRRRLRELLEETDA